MCRRRRSGQMRSSWVGVGRVTEWWGDHAISLLVRYRHVDEVDPDTGHFSIAERGAKLLLTRWTRRERGTGRSRSIERAEAVRLFGEDKVIDMEIDAYLDSANNPAPPPKKKRKARPPPLTLW